MLLLLYAIYQKLVRKPLERVLDETPRAHRGRRREGARRCSGGGSRAPRNTSRSCAKRGWPSSKRRKRGGSRPSNCGLRPWLRRAAAPRNRFARPGLPSNRIWLQRATGLQAEIDRLATGDHQYHPETGRGSSHRRRRTMKRRHLIRLAMIAIFAFLLVGALGAQDLF